VSSFSGWGRLTWGSGAWGSRGTLEVTGIEAAGAIGSESVTIVQTVAVTGVEATGSTGNITPGVFVSITATGVEAAGSLGSETVSAEVLQKATGVESAGKIGTVGKGTSFAVTGVSAEGLVSTANVWSVISTTQDPNWTRIAA
jgi:hypothetical protein